MGKAGREVERGIIYRGHLIWRDSFRWCVRAAPDHLARFKTLKAAKEFLDRQQAEAGPPFGPGPWAGVGPGVRPEGRAGAMRPRLVAAAIAALKPLTPTERAYVGRSKGGNP